MIPCLKAPFFFGGGGRIYFLTPSPALCWVVVNLCQEIKFIHVLYLIMIWMIWWGGSHWRYSDRCWANIFSMTLVQMVVQIWLILISFSTNLHYRACTHCECKAKRRDHIQKHLQMVHDGIDILVLIVITKLQQSTIWRYI